MHIVDTIDTRIRRMIRGLLCLFVSLVLCGIVLAADADAPVKQVDYTSDVKPILKRHCATCHGALRQRGGLRLDVGTFILQGGDSGPAVTPHEVEGSPLLEFVRSDGEEPRQMPPEGQGEPLEDKELAILTTWVEQGAVVPQDEAIPADPRKHWSFQVPTRPAVPLVAGQTWTGNPVDAFLAAKHEEHGLKPRPQASKEILLRRVSMDLIGLPPSRAELHAFLSDDSAGAGEKVVDRLLESPHYGERWGRHWMDVWRYADWAGYREEVRESQPHIWALAGLIVESLNADKPYDRMVHEMLAGDEIAPGDPDTLRATGFLVRNWYKFNRNVWLKRPWNIRPRRFWESE